MPEQNYTTKADYIELFSDFAKTAIKKDAEDLYYLYGKCVNVQQFDTGVWDVSLCNQFEYSKGNLSAFLGTGKLNNLIATVPEGFKVRRLDGEAYFQSYDIKTIKSWLLANRLALGIKKRKTNTTNNLKLAISSNKSAGTGA